MNVAVLFLVFNRAETTRQVFDAIRAAKPTRLYVAADGPRASCDGEAERCAEVRQIASSVDWPCEIKTLFRDQNLGCKLGVSSGIDWFFENEEEGIILEDDCVPHADFFKFSQEMLEKYRHDDRVGLISGTNLWGEGVISSTYDYTYFGSIWGWASWRRAWRCYEIDLHSWSPEQMRKALENNFPKPLASYLWSCYRLVRDHAMGTWDYQWLLSCIMNSHLSIVPEANLIKNIGVQGAHSQSEHKFNNLNYGGLSGAALKPRSTLHASAIFAAAYYQEYIRKVLPILRLSLFLRDVGLYAKVKAIRGRLS